MPTIAPYVFVCAAGHSGSTLLDLILGSHSQGVSLGEITHLPKNIALNTVRTCGAPVPRCRFWVPIVNELGEELRADLWRDPYRLHLGFINATNVVDRAHQTRLRMLHRRLVYAAEFARLRWRLGIPSAITRPLEDGARNKIALFEKVLRNSARDFVVDSSKHYLEAIHLYRAAPDKARIILLVRDGRAVFYSGIRRGVEWRRAIAAWSNIYDRLLPLFKQVLPEQNWLKVHYESLTSDPERAVQNL